MNKIYKLLGVFLLISCLAMAQSSPNRTATTIVADVLGQMPARNQKVYDKQMADLLSTKQEGVVQLAKMMQESPNGTNAKVEYALNGLASYVSNQNESDRLSVSNSFLTALDQVTHPEVKAFIIRQLIIVGKEETVEKLSSYLENDKLSSQAAMALASVGGEKAIDALANNLDKTSSPLFKANIINALGDLKATKAEMKILSLLNTQDEKLQQVVIVSLAKLGTEASLKSLEDLSKKEGYAYTKTGATYAYLGLLENLLSQGKNKVVEKSAKNLMVNAKKAGINSTSDAALNLLMGAKPKDAINLAVKSLKSSNPADRLNALRAASKNIDKQNIADLYSKLTGEYAKASTYVKVDLLNWFAEEMNTPSRKEILQSHLINILNKAIATETDYDVKKAALNCAVKLNYKGVEETIAPLLASSSSKDIELAKEALTVCGTNISKVLSEQIAASSDEGKIAILELLAQRKYSERLNTVIDQTNSNNEAVKKAAYSALKDVTTIGQITTMYQMLETSDAQYVTPLQDAIIASLSELETQRRFSFIADKFNNTPQNKKYLYYSALASTQDPKALTYILEGFDEGDKKAKDAAFFALSSWDGVEAMNHLLAIARDAGASSYHNKAADACIKIASNTKLSKENRVIYLREAMSVAQNSKQKSSVLKAIQKAGTFQGLIFAGKYLDDSDKSIQDAAAQAVMNIAINNPSFTGSEIKAILEKALKSLNNPDANYHREAIQKHLNEVPMDKGFVSIFNGKNLDGWKGLVANPIKRAEMSPATLKKEQEKADAEMQKDWKAQDGCIMFDGKGFNNLCTVKQYGDFEMYIDWMLDPSGKEADAGVYLRGTPQVQMWDISRTKVGAQVGSGGLYNNKKNASAPLKVADNQLGDWNSFYIKMVGDRVTVYLNGELVVDNIIMENYWDRSLPIAAIEQIELQAHGSKVFYRDIYIKELESVKPFELSQEEQKEGFKILFDGTNMHQWTGNTTDYTLENGTISLQPSKGSGGNLYTKDEFDNFVYRFEFMLPPGANNGVGIRAPLKGDAAYLGMEIQILDHDNPIYAKITPLQVHGSVYGIIGADRSKTKFKPVGEWNYEEIIADGDNIKVTLNGVVILEGNIKDAVKNGTADGKSHPGLSNKTGHIGFLGHGNPVKFRNIRIKSLPPTPEKK